MELAKAVRSLEKKFHLVGKQVVVVNLGELIEWGENMKFNKELFEEMVEFLVDLCHNSDVKWKGKRRKNVEKDYQRARDLIRRAGYDYIDQWSKIDD